MGEEQAQHGDKPKLWTRAFVTLACANFCSALTFYLLMVKITEYALVTYGVSYSLAGASVSALVIGALFSRIFFGTQIDRWGIKKSLVIGFGLSVLVSLLYFVPMGIFPLLVVRFLHGMGFGIASGAAAAGAAMIIPAARRGEGIGYFSMTQALATGVGPFVAILLTSGNANYTVLFFFTAAVSVVAFCVVFLIKHPLLSVSGTAGAATAKSTAVGARLGIGTFIQLSVVPLVLVTFFAYICYGSVISFLTVYTDAAGLSQAASLYFVVYAAVILLTRPSVGRRVDRRGENSVLYFSIIVLALGFIALAFSVNAVLLLLSAAFIGFGLGATQSVVQTTVVKMTKPEELGRANSTFFMSMDLGSGIGPVIIGAFIPFAGYQASFLGLAALIVITCVYYYFVHGRKAAAVDRAAAPQEVVVHTPGNEKN